MILVLTPRERALQGKILCLKIMRKFNKKLNADIGLLKQLHAKKDKSEFNKMKAVIMERHNISKATVYREMKKEVPGFYKKPQYYPPVRPVTLKEARMVRELLVKGTKIQDIQVILENETGERYSWDRVDMIRKEVDREAVDRGKLIEDSGKLIEDRGKGIVDSKKQEALSRCAEADGGLCGNESGFGEDIRVFLEKVLGVDNMSPGSVVTVNVKKRPIRYGYTAIKEIMMISANSENAGGTDVADHMIVTALHCTAELVRMYSQGKPAGTTDYLNVLRVYKEYRKAFSTSFSPDFKVTDACLQEAAPHLNEVERLLLIHKHYSRTKGASAASMDMDRLKEITAQAALENM